MQIRIFTIPGADSGVLQSEMNAFLSSHRVEEPPASSAAENRGLFISYPAVSGGPEIF